MDGDLGQAFSNELASFEGSDSDTNGPIQFNEDTGAGSRYLNCSLDSTESDEEDRQKTR